MSFAELQEFLSDVLTDHHRHHLTFQEAIMADFTKLTADIADLNAKVDAMLAKQSPPPVDEQPQVDQAAAAIEAISAKIPA